MPEYGKLLVLENNQLLQEFALTRPEITIGREPGNDFIINHREVSRRHARLSHSRERWLLENLSQSNPVRLNGNVLTGPTWLKEGDQFFLGSLVVQLVGQNQAGINPAAAWKPQPAPPPGPVPPPYVQPPF